MVKIIYNDIAVGAKADFTPSIGDRYAPSNLALLKQDGAEFPHYATLEQDQTILDGSQPIQPDSGAVIALWSNSLSGANGSFAAAPVLTMSAAGQYTSQGITITTDPDVWANSITIAWYRGGTLLSSADFTPDSAVFFCKSRVDSYNKVVITFRSLCLPGRRLKIRSIDFGVIRTFEGGALADVSVIQECSPISEEIAINTLDFTLIGDSEVNYVFQAKQPLKLYNNDALMGVFFVESYDRTADRFYTVKAEDYKSLLDAAQFRGGMYSGYSASTLIAEICAAANVPLSLDPALSSAAVTGWIPITTCREALEQAAFAVGAAVDTAGSDAVRVFVPSDTAVHHFGLGEIMQGQKLVDRDKKLTELRLTVHRYSASTESATLYSGDAGTSIYVEFAEPMHSLSITNGSIIESGANYAVIAALSGCELKGMKYLHTETVLTKRNPLTNVGDPVNAVEIRSQTLAHAGLLDALYAHYIKQGTIEGEMGITGQRPGDTVEIETEYSGTITAQIESMRYRLYGGAIVAEVSAR